MPPIPNTQRALPAAYVANVFTHAASRVCCDVGEAARCAKAVLQ